MVVSQCACFQLLLFSFYLKFNLSNIVRSSLVASQMSSHSQNKAGFAKTPTTMASHLVVPHMFDKMTRRKESIESTVKHISIVLNVLIVLLCLVLEGKKNERTTILANTCFPVTCFLHFDSSFGKSMVLIAFFLAIIFLFLISNKIMQSVCSLGSRLQETRFYGKHKYID